MSVVETKNRRGEAVSIALRTVSAVAGAYALAYYLAETLTGVFASMSVGRADAVMLASVVALVVFPIVSIWVFAERRLWVAAGLPAACAAVLALGAALIAP